MSKFLYHESCPDCWSVDNRAVFDDGHKFCFGCEVFTPPTKQERMENLLREDNYEKNKKSDRYYDLPDDFSYSIPDIGIDWVKKYGLTDNEIAANRIGWCNYKKLLYGALNRDDRTQIPYGHIFVKTMVFPFVNQETGRGEGWVGRTFANQLMLNSYKIPKYLNFVTPECFPLMMNKVDTHSVCLVEDVISAMKVKRAMSSFPLLGARLVQEDMLKLSRMFKRLVIWLDDDMLQRTIDIERQASPFFDKIETVSTVGDPKTYPDSAILASV